MRIRCREHDTDMSVNAEYTWEALGEQHKITVYQCKGQNKFNGVFHEIEVIEEK